MASDQNKIRQQMGSAMSASPPNPPPADFLGSLHHEWMDRGHASSEGMQDFASLEGMRIFPVSCTATEGSGASIKKDYGKLGAAGIEALGLDELRLTIECVLIPRGSPVPKGCNGFDHMPLLCRLWKSYRWVVLEARLLGREDCRPSISIKRERKKAIRVDEELLFVVELMGYVSHTP